MLKFSLDKLMEERRLSIQDVADKTGISRPTISQLYNNKSKGIQFETLNRLLGGLNADLYELFEEVFPDEHLKFYVDIDDNWNDEMLDSEDQNSISVSFVYDENIGENYSIASFRMPISTNISSDKSYPRMIFFNCFYDFLDNEGLPERNKLNLKLFLETTPSSELESILGQIVLTCIKELKIKEKFDMAVFRTDVGSDVITEWSLNVSWPLEILANEDKFLEYIKIKYS